MGHSRASKANTHVRLVEAAAARFKERGIDGISLADLMKELKLTHGGFYRHFDSREALVTEALALALEGSTRSLTKHLFKDGKPDLPGFVDFYLSEAHRDRRDTGCAVAALAGDASRKSTALQAQFSGNIDTNIALLAEAMGSREAAISLLCSLYCALIIARAVGDAPLSGEVLRNAKRQAAKVAAQRRPALAARRRGKAEPERSSGARPLPRGGTLDVPGVGPRVWPWLIDTAPEPFLRKRTP